MLTAPNALQGEKLDLELYRHNVSKVEYNYLMKNISGQTIDNVDNLTAEELITIIKKLKHSEILNLAKKEDKDGKTLLHSACLCTNENPCALAIVQALLEAGANPNIAASKTSRAWGKKIKEGGKGYAYKGTALHNALSAGNVPIVCLLLRHGADINLKNGHNDKPFCVLTDQDPGAKVYLERQSTKYKYKNSDILNKIFSAQTSEPEKFCDILKELIEGYASSTPDPMGLNYQDTFDIIEAMLSVKDRTNNLKYFTSSATLPQNNQDEKLVGLLKKHGFNINHGEKISIQLNKQEVPIDSKEAYCNYLKKLIEDYADFTRYPVDTYSRLDNLNIIEEALKVKDQVESLKDYTGVANLLIASREYDYLGHELDDVDNDEISPEIADIRGIFAQKSDDTPLDRFTPVKKNDATEQDGSIKQDDNTKDLVSLLKKHGFTVNMERATFHNDPKKIDPIYSNLIQRTSIQLNPRKVATSVDDPAAAAIAATGVKHKTDGSSSPTPTL